MTLTLSGILSMAWRTVKNPREGAEEMLALGVPREALWTALALVVVLSIILAQLTAMLMASAGSVGGLVMSPTAQGVVQLVLLVVMVFAIYYIGRAMGGTGSFEEGILLVAWLQFIMVCVQVAQTIALLIVPPVAALLGLIAMVLFFWLLTNFIAVLHGFKSLAQVFVMILVSAFGIVFLLSILLAILGVSVPVGAV